MCGLHLMDMRNRIIFYPLEPEWQAKSTNPIHPFALIQKNPYTPEGSAPIQRGEKFAEPLPTRSQDAYDWLNTTFHWRPVFDWDWFVKPDPEDQHRNLDVAYADMKYSLEVGGGKAQSNALMAEIATQFQYMKDSGIPVHVLLGRRNPDESSLYWDWPYDAKAWEKSLTAPVEAGLKPVAAHIDTLSILYDFRNPLDERRLREIDDRRPYHGPDAHCPRLQCPWNNKDCPFKKQWDQKSVPKAKGRANSSGQKMANRQPLVKPGSKHKLASNLPSCPPTGEDADNGTSENSNPGDYTPATLHHLATSAAFEREAVGWQSFWASHASQLTNLTEL
jgi:hypothetical protein